MKTQISIILLALFFAACSPKTNPKIDALTAQNLILEKTTKINELNIELEKVKLEIVELTKDAKDANNDAVSSARDANKATEKMNSNPGSSKAANKADNYADDAASDAKKASKINFKLAKLNDEVSDLQKKIEKTQNDLNKLNAK